jgi:hypothetical protein
MRREFFASSSLIIAARSPRSDGAPPRAPVRHRQIEPPAVIPRVLNRTLSATSRLGPVLVVVAERQAGERHALGTSLRRAGAGWVRMISHRTTDHAVRIEIFLLRRSTTLDAVQHRRYVLW